MQAYTFLKNRGLIYQSSQALELALQTITSSNSIYLGVDPTAKGLHIGHLMAFRALKRFHQSGIRCIALVCYTIVNKLVKNRLVELLL